MPQPLGQPGDDECHGVRGHGAGKEQAANPLAAADHLQRLAGSVTAIEARPMASSPEITAKALAPGFVRQPFEMIDVVDFGYDTHSVTGLPATRDSPIRARPPKRCRTTGSPDTPHSPVQARAISSLTSRPVVPRDPVRRAASGGKGPPLFAYETRNSLTQPIFYLLESTGAGD